MERKNVQLFALLALLLLLGGCSYRPDRAAQSVAPAAAESSAPEFSYTVSYYVNGQLWTQESVAQGAFPSADAEPDMGGDAFLGWCDASGTVIDTALTPVHADVSYSAVAAPALTAGDGFFAPWQDALFHPAETFTRSDAARAVYELLAEKPVGETFLQDVTTRAQCYQAATALVTAGYLSLTDGKFDPDVAISQADFTALLSRLFPFSRLREALAPYEFPLNRGQAAAVFCTLLGLSGGEAYYPDVAPGSEYYAAVGAAGQDSGQDWGARQGFINLDGYLYSFGADGYFLRDADLGTLHFGSDCRYTSGDETLDLLVAERLESKILPGTRSQEEALRKAYEYVRDSFLYLRRNYYEVGESGWEVSEAVTMLTSGKGNCYNFTGAFWALCRGLGYDAQCLSGLVGHERDPHSWVEIPWEDGVTYIFDPETEMSYELRDLHYDLYKMTYEQGEFWSYAREPYPEEDTAESAE